MSQAALNALTREEFRRLGAAGVMPFVQCGCLAKTGPKYQGLGGEGRSTPGREWT